MSTLAPIPPPAPPPIPPPSEQEMRTWNMWSHLSALAGLVVPCGGIIGPILLWQIKKDSVPSVVSHGKAALNFQLTVLIAEIVVWVVTIILMFVCIGYLLLPVAIAFHFVGPIFALIAGIKASEGKEYKYPWSLTLIA